MRVSINHGGKEGFVKYNEGNREVMVTHPNEAVRNTLRHYLTTKREFIVPADNDPSKVGNRAIVTKVPNEDSFTMKMALSELEFNTGISVNWGHEDNLGIKEENINEDSNKPILKGIDGEDYEILN